MPSCIVKGCRHHTSTKSSNPLYTMHVFPRELSRIKLWLQKTGQDFDNIDAFAAKILDAAKTGKYRICSAHFSQDCYTTVGCRLVLKHDAIPTIFPGAHSKLAPKWKPFTPHVRKGLMGPDVSGKDNVSAAKPRKDAATQTNVEYDKTRPKSLNTSLMERCNKQEEIFDASGRLVGVFSPNSQQRDLRVRPGLWTYDWSTQIPKEPSRPSIPMENKEALSSLEKVLLSLLKHMREAPHSRPQKQRTSRLLNRTAEIISMLTGEDWTVVKKNAHISKFYQMIREVPIKCGDVAMFFTMDEWEYIEDHEDLYKPVILENPKDGKVTPSLTIPGSSQEKAPISQPQPSTNADSNTGIKAVIDISQPPDCHGTPIPISTGYKALHVPAKQPVIPETPEQCKSSLSDSNRLVAPKSAAHMAESSESLKEEEDTDASLKQNSIRDADHTHHTAKDEEFIKEEKAVDTHMMEIFTAKVGHRWSLKNDSCQSESSELWIAQDGTTSSSFMPEDHHRPPGRTLKTYSRKLPLFHCPVSYDMTKPDCLRFDLTGSKRVTTGSEHWCDQCNEHFRDKHHLEDHQKLHAKKPRR